MENFIPIKRTLEKYELFQRVVAKVCQTLPIHKTTKTEEYTSVCFMTKTDDGGITRMSEDIKAKKSHSEIILKYQSQHYTKEYITITYDLVKDKISVGEFEIGWFYAPKKARFYPGKKRRPLICYSKKFYVFHFKDRKPRLMNGSSIGMWSKTVQIIAQELLGLDYKPSYDIILQAKYYLGTKDEWQAIENSLGIKIPKALRVYTKQDIYNLISCLKNPNEVSTLCMYLAKNKVADIPPSEEDWGMSHKDIFNPLTKMMGIDKSWLIRDYFHDLFRLKRKTTLKITSIKRIEDEYAKMSREIQVLGIKAIKVHDCYVEMFKTCPIEGAELILDKKRLLHEGISQEHCVASYGNSINSGACCIISIPYQGKQFTLQVSKEYSIVDSVHTGHYNTRKDRWIYRKVQFLGFRNGRDPEYVTPQGLHDQVDSWLASLPPIEETREEKLVEKKVRQLAMAADLPF